MTGPIESSVPLHDKHRKKKFHESANSENDFMSHFNDQLMDQESLEQTIANYMSSPMKGSLSEVKDSKRYQKIIFDIMNKL